MNDNPYAHAGLNPAALAAADERAGFLQRTYSLLLAGVLVFAATLWMAGNVEPVSTWAADLGRVIYGNRFGWLLYLGLFIGGGMAVHAVAERRPINLVAFFAYSGLLGLLLAPLLLFVAQINPDVITQAAVLTGVTFTGLTAAVFVTGKDFSFMRGALFAGAAVLMGIAICSMLFGFAVGTWFSALCVLLFAGYILYDTGAILHRYPTTMHVSAAVVLLTDVVLLFKHLVILLMSSRD